MTTDQPTVLPHTTATEVDALAVARALADQLVRGWSLPLPAVSVHLSARLTRCAGLYRPPGRITLSRHFLREHGETGALGVVRHEVAHHIVHHTTTGRVRPHGREFQAVAAQLAAPRWAAPFRAPRTLHMYSCAACGWTVQRGRRLSARCRYSCARCAPTYNARFPLAYIETRRVG